MSSRRPRTPPRGPPRRNLPCEDANVDSQVVNTSKAAKAVLQQYGWKNGWAPQPKARKWLRPQTVVASPPAPPPLLRAAPAPWLTLTPKLPPKLPPKSTAPAPPELQPPKAPPRAGIPMPPLAAPPPGMLVPRLEGLDIRELTFKRWIAANIHRKTVRWRRTGSAMLEGPDAEVNLEEVKEAEIVKSESESEDVGVAEAEWAADYKAHAVGVRARASRGRGRAMASRAANRT